MNRVLFIYLKAFSLTGGIEKYNRSFLKALYDLDTEKNINASAISMYDSLSNEQYFPQKKFKGFSGKKIFFLIYVIQQALRKNVLIIGHINLAIVGVLVKKIKPSVKLVLIAHGIDVWSSQTGIKKKLLQKVDEVWAVSNFTKLQMIAANSFIEPSKVSIFPNTLDPYFTAPQKFIKPEYLLNRYDILPSEKVILTVTRLSATEKFKGYDNTIAIIAKLNAITNYKIKYLLCGKYEAAEFTRLQELIEEHNAAEFIQLTGFVKDEELIDHYLLADVFVMPSKKEGFGIVFIEAMACGRLVIAGNKDGSVDALQNGKLGTLINPDDKEELLKAIAIALEKENQEPEKLQQNVIEAFGFNTYKQRLKNYLSA